MEPTRYDLVVFGATGFTGRQTARALLGSGCELTIAIAGRSQQRLADLADSLGGVPVIVADGTNAEDMERLARSARVIVSTAGPFAQYSDRLARACAAAGTDYCDITGETPWVRRLIDDVHETARDSGARIVPFCGVDSVPSDLCARLAARRLQTVHDQAASEMLGVWTLKGGLNGGTAASALSMAENGDVDALEDPVLLDPPEQRTDARRAERPDERGVEWSDAVSAWTAPFFMAPVNTRVVRRSAGLFAAWGEGYGEGFRYRERMKTGSRLEAQLFALATDLSPLVIRSAFGLKTLRMLAPAPGHGPSESTMDNGYTRCQVFATGEQGARVVATLTHAGDPGNRATIRMLAAAAITLARDEARERSGVLTPATALGEDYLDALAALDISVTVEDIQSES